jgi:hypothetical protein
VFCFCFVLFLFFEQRKIQQQQQQQQLATTTTTTTTTTTSNNSNNRTTTHHTCTTVHLRLHEGNSLRSLRLWLGGRISDHPTALNPRRFLGAGFALARGFGRKTGRHSERRKNSH